MIKVFDGFCGKFSLLQLPSGRICFLSKLEAACVEKMIYVLKIILRQLMCATYMMTNEQEACELLGDRRFVWMKCLEAYKNDC